ncbi:YfbM family protein [Methylomonas methanica]|uniref:DUF1877 domain-containing protein n=1 Tax=Methylomonas methanica (strain DSM 25384 / MC09) TaxID=857087 RepID=G0A4W5_METMM|nr:YfbM family protein [Methylomonas methanica]AEF99128.1 Domain of unknown function DUF1877 [Methylomonas methanica MC09]
MSMLFTLQQVELEQLESLIKDPSDIFFFLHGPETYIPKKGFFSRLFAAPEPPAQRPWQALPEDSLLDLDKNWHILHYLLADCPWDGPLPQATLLSGGIQLGDVDVGYGPARALRPADIKAFLSFLNDLKADEFGANVSQHDFDQNEIYCSANWQVEDGNLLWTYVVALQNFLREAVARNKGIILYIY